MEVIKCPTGRVFDESINECVTDKVLGFTFDKKLCDTTKTPVKGSQPQNSSGILTIILQLFCDAMKLAFFLFFRDSSTFTARSEGGGTFGASSTSN